MIEAQLGAGIAAHRSGDLAQAQTLYEAVLRADPHQADALLMLGIICQHDGDLTRARLLMETSIAVRPNLAGAHYNLAIVRGLQGDVAGAVAAYEAAVDVAPDFAEAHSNLGNAYLAAGRRDDALRAYAAAIRAKPDFAAAYCNLGTVLIDLERFDEAVGALEAALRLAPDVAEAHANLGQAYRRSGRFRAALEPTRRALELRPDYREAYLNLALCAFELDALDLAREAIAEALARGGANAEVYCSSSWIRYMSGDYAQAIAAAEAAVALRFDYPEAHVNLALSLLVTGELARGWDEYVWMWRVPSRRAAYPYLDRAPLWRGESFVGRRLVIARDQGFGDAIQMVRYLPAVKARGGRVILEVAPALAPLFADLAGVDEVRIRADATVAADDADLQIPALGLPGALGTLPGAIPAAVPYLRADPERVERWRARLARPALLRIGIVWAGFSGHAGDRHRSVRLEDFAALGDVAGIAWFGLQKGRDEDRRSAGSLTLDPLGAEIVDFADTAAILAQLDLVIAVDTSIVHLAGALGRPVWTLLPFAPDWRWLLDRDDSPWYPTMRLFRQPRAGDWASVFAAVGRELRAVTATVAP